MKNSIELLRAEIEMKEQEIRKMQALISDKEKQQSQIEPDPDDYVTQFDEYLDENGTVDAGGYSFYPSCILKELDLIAYRCGLNDYADSVFDASETDEYNALQEEIDDIREEIYHLKSDIEDLESEIEDLENQIEDLTE